jgi:protein-L-isoaspartate(D-aspartate) O-methyltransferase
MRFATSRQDKIEEMVRTIEAECALTAGMTGIRAFRPEVMAAMAQVPRDEFVPPAMQPHAFANNPLPIGDGQTISQPFIVALMTELLDPDPDKVILEVGTGSGYQAAILAGLVRQVYSLDILPGLAQRAKDLLRRLGYANVDVRAGDGYRGWPEHAPFDGIIVTAAASHVPPPLTEQLRPGGRLVIPVGLPYMHQELLLIEKDRDGQCHTRDVLGVAFVPLTGREGHDEPGENS